MRKILTFASISMLVMLVAGFAVETPVFRPHAASAGIDAKTTCEMPVSVSYSVPLRVDLGVTGEVPEGFHRVSVKPKSEEKAQALWLRSFGTLDGYSFEKAGTINLIVEDNAMPPCACHIEGMRYDYRKVNGEWQCDDTCPPRPDK